MKLRRYPGNPIIEPNPLHKWESKAVFNPAAFIRNGTIHILYRAVGEYECYISKLGHAWSEDGINFQRSPKPVLSPSEDYDKWGCEDPRSIVIGEEVYITYTGVGCRESKPVFIPNKRIQASSKQNRSSGKTVWAVALCSTRDLKTFKKYGVISDVMDKDAAIFPEKINGRWVMIHRIIPNMLISFSDDMIHWYGTRVLMCPRKSIWDSSKIGGGAPPIKTSKGWLIFYHGVDEEHIYRLGVALLELNNPTRVLARQEEPILEPEKEFELKGDVPNVVFTCGAVERNEEYWVYYGGGDKMIGLATVKKKDALDFC